MSTTIEHKDRRAFSLIELMVVMTVLAVLGTLIVSAVSEVRERSLMARSTANLRQLVAANFACVADTGHFAKAENVSDTKRWHGSKANGEWVGYGGYLTPYLGEDRQIRLCPGLEKILQEDEGEQFDEGTGGYGYNAFYLGQSPHLPAGVAAGMPTLGAKRGSIDVEELEAVPNTPAMVFDPARTVMFTTAALVKEGGVVETYLSAPYHEIAGGTFGQRLTPTTHFRFNGEALVAWCDGRVTLEPPNDANTSHNVYGDDNDKYQVGWFGPTDNNGYWNPNYASGQPF